MMEKKGRVLVVEDDHDALEAILDLLDCEGYSVVGARTADEALLILTTTPTPAIVVCDVLLPGMNGAELGATLPQDPRLSRVPILYFSAARSADRLVGAAVLKKPFSRHALLTA